MNSLSLVILVFLSSKDMLLFGILNTLIVD